MGALVGGGLGALGAGVPQNMSGLKGFSLFDDDPEESTVAINPGNTSYGNLQTSGRYG